MQYLDNIFEFLIENIEASKITIPDQIEKQIIQSASESIIKNYQDKNHRIKHQSMPFKLKNCENDHCIECLIFYKNSCSHGCQFTPYESSLIKELAKKQSSTSLENIPNRICMKCQSGKPALEYLKKSCDCECFNCLNTNLKFGLISCSICQLNYNKNGLTGLYNRLSADFPGLNSTCPTCSLPIKPEDFYEDSCVVCYLMTEFN